MSTAFLFSVDVEDIRRPIPSGENMMERVPALTRRYPTFLSRHGATGTFFVVGDVARKHPDLIRSLVDEGHEIGCHSDGHVAVTRQSRAEFRDDVCRNLDALHSAGAERIQGYRAPYFSLTRSTPWVHATLAELGFTYSSSVLPAANPLFGWPEFGSVPRLCDGVLELPVTLFRTPIGAVPLAGGVYFRVLPRTLLRAGIQRLCRHGVPVLSYAHPYDLDTSAPWHRFPELSAWNPAQLLMYLNRGEVIARFEMVASMGLSIQPYGPYARMQREMLGMTVDDVA